MSFGHSYEDCTDYCFDYEAGHGDGYWSCVLECMVEECGWSIASLVAGVPLPPSWCDICIIPCAAAAVAPSKGTVLACGACLGVQVGICMWQCY